MKKFLIGCGIVALLALILAAIAVVSFGPRLARWGGDVVHKMKDEVGREQARADAVLNWSPALQETTAESLFPLQVGTATRTVVQNDVALPALGVNAPGRHAAYALGGSTVEVWAFPVNELERDGLLAHIQKAHDSGSGTRSMISLPSRRSFSSASAGTSHIFTPPGWVFVFRPQGEIDVLPFTDAFFGAPAAESTPAPAR